ncbi:MAG: SsrA-binding protein SmpB [Acidobacteria bacterium]|nr:SsrA-binding protein SmpB [Acidobacteriota bacterium]
MAKPDKDESRAVATNRKAYHEYEILDKIEAGMVLQGTEVKSLRDGKANLKDSYVIFRGGEAFLLNTHISPYRHGNIANHDPERTRKLLLQRREIEKLAGSVTQKGLTVIPLKIYFRDGKAKVEIAVVRGKKLFDKRETERRKEAERETASAIKKWS